MMDFHMEDRLKNLPQPLICGAFYLQSQAVSSTKDYHKANTEIYCYYYKCGACLIFQYRRRTTTTSEGQPSLLIHATQSSTQVKVAKTVDFLYKLKSNVEKSFTNKTSPFIFRLFKDWTFLLTLRSVRKPNLQYIICCCLTGKTGVERCNGSLFYSGGGWGWGGRGLFVVVHCTIYKFCRGNFKLPFLLA